MYVPALVTAVTLALALPAMAAAGYSKRAPTPGVQTAAGPEYSKRFEGAAAVPLHRRAVSAAPASLCADASPYGDAVIPVCCARVVEPDARDASVVLSALGTGVQGAFVELASWALSSQEQNSLVGLTCTELGSTPGDIDDCVTTVACCSDVLEGGIAATGCFEAAI